MWRFGISYRPVNLEYSGNEQVDERGKARRRQAELMDEPRLDGAVGQDDGRSLQATGDVNMNFSDKPTIRNNVSCRRSVCR